MHFWMLLSMIENEMGNRPVSEVPHPLVTETEDLFQKESSAVKRKFILSTLIILTEYYGIKPFREK